MAVDLAHAHQPLALKGRSPIDVVLGAEMFDARSAEIDYGSKSLFLRS